jgi:ATP-dependent RNA helicase SUPV3L1/SUV3
MEINCIKNNLEDYFSQNIDLINQEHYESIKRKVLSFFEKHKNVSEKKLISKMKEFNTLVVNEYVHKKIDKSVTSIFKKIQKTYSLSSYEKEIVLLFFKGIKKTLIKEQSLNYYEYLSHKKIQLFVFSSIKPILKNLLFLKDKVVLSKNNFSFFSQFFSFEDKNNYLKALFLNSLSEHNFDYSKKNKKITVSIFIVIKEKLIDISVSTPIIIENNIIEDYFNNIIDFKDIVENCNNQLSLVSTELKEEYSFEYDYYLELSKNIENTPNIEIPVIKYFGKYNLNTKHEINKKIKNYCDELDTIYGEILFKNNIGQRRFGDMFPMARSKTRKFTFYIGETGSGKTYNALRQIKDKSTGLFLAPLRLLALEGQENIEELGFPCNLITGEEKDIKEDAMFCSSTIEMLDVTEEYDIIIIDECQMLFDENRGWAWTQAIVGSNAEEIVLTGSAEALEAIKFLTDYTGDKLEIIELKKKTKAEKYKENVRSVRQIKDHTAVVCFSKKRILELKNIFEKQTGNQASVIFGALSPETRKEEARRFREEETKVVFATDAIGLGLNLPIENVLFDTLEKFNGKNKETISSSLAKQIVGRAGRFGFFNTGYYGMFDNKEQPKLDKLLKEDYPEHTNHFYYKVPFVVFQEISELIESENCYDIINKFIELYDLVEENFIKMDYTDLIYKAKKIEDELFFIPDANILKLYEKYKLIFSPLDVQNEDLKYFFDKMVKDKLLKLKDFDFDSELRSDYTSIKTIEDLNLIEYKLSIIDTYNWLSFNFPDIFKISQTVINREKFYLNELVMFFLKEDGELYKQCETCKTHIKLGKERYCQPCFKNKNKKNKH